ncbi:hypothetical protein [Pseudoxanthomonas mexicana]|uniref:hypothetical protein n=1 Tax=Pseudoxanthomonas mexicana TaxID=128785 RepID=UPI00398AAFBC
MIGSSFVIAGSATLSQPARSAGESPGVHLDECLHAAPAMHVRRDRAVSIEGVSLDAATGTKARPDGQASPGAALGVSETDALLRAARIVMIATANDAPEPKPPAKSASNSTALTSRPTMVAAASAEMTVAITAARMAAFCLSPTSSS